jgi:hypothetical protein
MNITSARYKNDPVSGKENDIIIAVINDTEWCVPNNAPKNSHYAEIMRQVAAGELTIADAD